jgi:serine/threonine-protein kinase
MTSPFSSEPDFRTLAGGLLEPAAELQRRWKSGQKPRIEQFLNEWPGISPRELAAVMRVELRQRWRQGQKPRAEDFLERFPQLRTEVEDVVDLIYAEFLIREELCQNPSLEEFERRFPEHAQELKEQIELHAALGVTEQSPPLAFDTNHSPSATEPNDGHQRFAARLPSLAPNYEVLAEIGRGGMGVVYRARQVGLNRLVALKMLRAAESASSELLSRFRVEAEAVARLHHPQIVQIYDYGEHDGLPYLALELIEHGTLAARLDGTPWPAHKAAGLVETLARSVEFAHDHGVIHRDLKPANILLASADGSDVKIADFGLARVFRDIPSVHTQSGALLGTPSYMSPEQAAGRAQQIGPATDVYALGAILYELLTGHPPFRGETPIETLQQVLTSEPVTVRLIAPRVPRDLATICSKCLGRDPEQRYLSAAELASDLARFLADQPIRARPTSSWERGWRWCRRNPALAGALGTVAALLFCMAAVSTWYSARLSFQLQKTEQAEQAERLSSQTAKLRLWDAYLAEIAARNSSRRIGQRFATLETVNQANVLFGEIGREPGRVLQLRNAAIAALALPDLRPLRQIDGWPAEGNNMALSAAADRYVAATMVGDLYVYRLSDGRELLRLEFGETEVVPAISQDGTYVAATSNLGTKIWRIDAAAPTVVWEEDGAPLLTFSPDSTLAAVSGRDGRMHLLDLGSGRKIRYLGRGAAQSRFAFHPDSQRIAVCGPQSVQVISVETGDVLSELSPPKVINKLFPAVAWHPSGEFLAVAGYENGIALFRIATEQRIMSYPHRGAATHCYFVAGGDQLLTYDTWSGNLYLWNTTGGRELLSERTFDYFVGDVSPTGQRLLLAKEGSHLRLWEVDSAPECSALPQGLYRTLGSPISTDISPDGRLLAIGRENGLDVWDLSDRRLVSLELARLCFARFAADGSLIAHCENGIFRWPRQVLPGAENVPPGGAPQPLTWRFGPPEELCGPTVDLKFAMTATPDLLVVQGRDGWQVTRPGSSKDGVRLGPQGDPRMVSLSADGRWVALGSWNSHGASVYESRSGTRIAELPVGRQADVLFSPDGRWLATAPDGGQLWHTEDWRPGPELHGRGATGGGLGMAFSPDSQVLALGQPTGETRLVDTATGEDWATLAHPDGSLGTYLAFSPDQLRLVIMASGPDTTPYVWNLEAIRRELAQRGLDWPADVLKSRPNAAQAVDGEFPLTITFDVGSLLRKQQAQGLLRQAATAQKIQARDLLQRALEVDPDNARACNQLAWLLVTGPSKLRDAATALKHARRAVELEPANGFYINTLGVALYRNAEYYQAISMLELSLKVNRQQSGGYDQLFLALCHQALGDATAAHSFFAEATHWFDANRGRLSADSQEELSCLLDEARAIIAKCL